MAKKEELKPMEVAPDEAAERQKIADGVAQEKAQSEAAQAKETTSKPVAPPVGQLDNMPATPLDQASVKEGMAAIKETDIKSLYLNNGYLFSSVIPVEKAVRGDSIDIEIRIKEGEKATWNRVTWSGNTTTHDHEFFVHLEQNQGIYSLN